MHPSRAAPQNTEALPVQFLEKVCRYPLGGYIILWVLALFYIEHLNSAR